MTTHLPVIARPGYEPTRAHLGDAGLDLRAAHDQTITTPGHAAWVSTGVKAAIPEGHVGLLMARSSLYKHGLELANAVGVIDAGYRGEIIVAVRNIRYSLLALQSLEPGDRSAHVKAGQRIAQLLIVPIAIPEVKLVNTLPATERGTGGFGSTGA
ncbi:dUTP diphosphatase [Corynebacterium mastitidis]|uniref:dUTP diphosphatase n=1 Tax=Corynebacterium mastitidis TaxID=161890 RepID=UPI00036BD1E5|nr:dUTP diphosphatase [Corynebacterium mastitidis]